jgi:hypothetical protein
MLRWIDRSRFLSGVLDWFSNLLAKRRGLPIVAGITLVSLSLILQSVNVFTDSELLDLIGIIVHHSGVLIALLGLLLATPLGR